jgi:hypothetical protein
MKRCGADTLKQGSPPFEVALSVDEGGEQRWRDKGWRRAWLELVDCFEVRAIGVVEHEVARVHDRHRVDHAEAMACANSPLHK